MASSIDTTNKRNNLKPRREPYFEKVSHGAYVGYRKPNSGAGTWVARRLVEGTKKYVFRSLGELPDYETAKKQAEQWADAVGLGVNSKAVTVAEVCSDYVDHIRLNNSAKSSADAAGRFRRLVYGQPIGAVKLDKLTAQRVSKWLNDQVDEDGDDDDLRRSKDSANRNLNTFKAALNLAVQNRLVATDAGWKSVRAFQDVGRRRETYLTPDQCQALMKECQPDLAAFLRGLLVTACRAGELAAANVSAVDFQRGAITLSGKTGTRVATLSNQALALMRTQCANKLPTAPLFTDARGVRWNKDMWKDPIKEAARAAKLPDTVVAYTLRHVAISEMMAGGVDSFVVARLSGTSVAMIEKHYGHLRHDATRAKLNAAIPTYVTGS